MKINFSKLVICLLSYKLTGCTAAGVFLDGSAQNSQSANIGTTNSNQTKNFVKDPKGFSFAKLGFEIDSAVIGLLKPKEEEPQLVCRQITRSIKECEEVKPSH